MKNARDDVPFSYQVKVGHISANPVEVHVEADTSELKALAETWNVVSVDDLSADLQIARWKRDGVRIKGRVQAKIVQSCVVTLEPVESAIDESFEQIFVPEGSKLARQAGNDAGEVVAEFAALAIDPYPRKEGIEFDGHIEDSGEGDKKPSAFAALKDWKKD